MPHFLYSVLMNIIIRTFCRSSRVNILRQTSDMHFTLHLRMILITSDLCKLRAPLDIESGIQMFDVCRCRNQSPARIARESFISYKLRVALMQDV